MITLFSIFLLLPLPILLNRWRGTGEIFNIFGFKLIGNIIYALYIALLIGFATAISSILLPFTTIVLNGTDAVYIFENNQIFSSFIFALVGAGLYIAGESFAWGKWVGWLTNYDGVGKPDYDNDDGRSFPYIHYMAQFIVKQEVNYTRYCEVALTIRGFVWWILLFIFIYSIGLISGLSAILSVAFLSFGFPVAAYIGNMIHIEYRSKYLNMSRGWENQELVYGLIQFICLNLPIFLTLYFN